MKKKKLTERLQQLAGIKPLYEIDSIERDKLSNREMPSIEQPPTIDPVSKISPTDSSIEPTRAGGDGDKEKPTLSAPPTPTGPACCYNPGVNDIFGVDAGGWGVVSGNHGSGYNPVLPSLPLQPNGLPVPGHSQFGYCHPPLWPYAYDELACKHYSVGITHPNSPAIPNWCPPGAPC
tara:strand:- start:372 stop:902 length:531 start_codon:yes stop_codon:yes gene_type:complete